jgi:glycosyltransferase involved in cell wall biosynthesis
LLFARAQGWRTVLGQIDAGPVGERSVARAYAGDLRLCGDWKRPPAQYWADWREECALADRIVVNSLWSQAALEEASIPASKIHVVPLAYEGPSEAAGFRRQYPKAFTMSRRLRVLFLGSVCLGKGVRPLFDAIRLLRSEAVEFWFVGALQAPIPAGLRDHPHVHWIGQVPRSETSKFYRNSDVFVFPTFSDGFGLTQLEAQAWKLPIITTKYCGDVVANGRNGWLLTEPTGATIAAAIRRCLKQPELLGEFAANAVQTEQFGLTQIGSKLVHIFD